VRRPPIPHKLCSSARTKLPFHRSLRNPLLPARTVLADSCPPVMPSCVIGQAGVVLSACPSLREFTCGVRSPASWGRPPPHAVGCGPLRFLQVPAGCDAARLVDNKGMQSPPRSSSERPLPLAPDLLHGTVLYCTVLYCTVLYSAVLYCCSSMSVCYSFKSQVAGSLVAGGLPSTIPFVN